MTRVLGIEGTAWAASASIYDSGADADPFQVSDAYEPESGGIHPREAAEHMRTAIPAVVEQAVDHARETVGTGSPVDAVAFARGPGLGPCLRIVATAARALAQRLDVPLVGVNHMIGHLEIGRSLGELSDPICLNASGANAHVLAYHGGRYRILGETMDTGVGNALDKFARHLDWGHPGGPKVERAAAQGSYVELPYVVKGMDFSFSGIMSAAKAAVDDGMAVEDVCCGLQESAFGMLTEVTERALSLTNRTEVVLGGGVGQNARLREMLESMCRARGATVYAPPPRYLRDNAAMIALVGAHMYDAGDTLALPESAVRPDYRPDEVAVGWRSPPTRAVSPEQDQRRGAEAVVDLDGETVLKRRDKKPYRHETLDERLRAERTRSEARLTSEARRAGVPTPVVSGIDPAAASLRIEQVGSVDLSRRLHAETVRRVGAQLATLHRAGVVHGDLTPGNVRVAGSPETQPQIWLIDFGLAYHSADIEDQAMDLHVFEQAVGGIAEDAPALFVAFEEAYAQRGDQQVLSQLANIEDRGRYR